MSDNEVTLDLDAIQARAQAATPGPWAGFEDGIPGGEKAIGLFYDVHNVHVVSSWTGDVEDAQFVTHARTDVPALVARVRDLEDRLGRIAGANEVVHAHRFDLEPNTEVGHSEPRKGGPDCFYNGIEFAHKRIRDAIKATS